MPAYVVKSRDAWIAQARTAQATLEAKSPAGERVTLGQMDSVDHDAFASLIEALVALGQPVAPDLVAKAGLRPVSEVLGLPS